ncbi:MAG: hypothetical protein KJO05_12385 [Bacteroidia bacterium]|nr:hypothetical protein [Bacteroidia bacterium]NNF31191.1 hypothetical protein [Flavobacteriaceae bacterium]MBT8274817.1 hypothetical protein [Bacteroidia bacterium]NNJ80630.1 hypothetical protein [Flavobacteriaceae bacterium]NNK54621.1 hypothetical protein [Flavobacteriaceae bacterium]
MKKKSILVIVIGIVVLAVIGYNYLYQDHREISSEKPMAELSSESISEIFKNDAANDLLNATVSVKGVISEIDESTLTLDGKVTCSFADIPSDYRVGDSINVKGRCIGYDDLFEIVKLDQCSIQN